MTNKWKAKKMPNFPGAKPKYELVKNDASLGPDGAYLDFDQDDIPEGHGRVDACAVKVIAEPRCGDLFDYIRFKNDVGGYCSCQRLHKKTTMDEYVPDWDSASAV